MSLPFPIWSPIPCNAHVVLRQVGASNELPESEELDALYDRFLIRRQVAQVQRGSSPLSGPSQKLS